MDLKINYWLGDWIRGRLARKRYHIRNDKTPLDGWLFESNREVVGKELTKRFHKKAGKSLTPILGHWG